MTGNAVFLGIDTSNYTCSAALYSPCEGLIADERLPLAVKPGSVGLRQSDAVFLHTKHLPVLMKRIFSKLGERSVAAVAATERPRSAEGSYMPCFLAGVSVAVSVASALGCPYIDGISHQQGHLMAALWSAGCSDWTDYAAWHVSGGTTELLRVTNTVNAECIGGTTDLKAGQLIDRIGAALGLGFPAGPALEKLAATAKGGHTTRFHGENSYFSLSGLENKARALIAGGAPPQETARFLLDSICAALVRATLKSGSAPVLCAGGVMANAAIRTALEKLGCVFAEPRYASDNAVGVALMASRLVLGV